jgi:hypothetical protein
MRADREGYEPPRLVRVSLSKDSARIWMRFKLDRPLPHDAAPLMLCLYVDGPGVGDRMQFGLTLARGHLRRYFVIDQGVPHLHELSREGFVMGDTVVVAPFDAHWLASVKAPMTFSALLMYDAADVQGDFPVSVLNELA